MIRLPPTTPSSSLLACTHFSTSKTTIHLTMEPSASAAHQNDQNVLPTTTQPPLSKNAQKRLLKQQRYEAKKAEKKALLKEHKRREAERKRGDWEKKLSGVSEEEKQKLIDDRKKLRQQRMRERDEERCQKMERLSQARVSGQNIVVDLEFGDLMSHNELQSLVKQIIYCYAINGRCTVPAHLWLTGCKGEMQKQLLQISGYDKWIIEKEERSYLEAFKDQNENLVYLTADSQNILDELNPKAIYIVGGLVDRNRWKGITMNKASEQGIKTAKLPIGAYMKMTSSQVLTVNQVVEILLKFLETKDWKDSFFHVIPLRKRSEASGFDGDEIDDEQREAILEEDEDNKLDEINISADYEDEEEDQNIKRQCI